MTRFALPLLMMLAACGEAPLPRPMTVRTLRAHASGVEAGGILVEAEPVTSGNWKQRGDLVAHLQWEQMQTIQAAEAGATGVGRMRAQGRVLRSEEVPLLPLPSFFVRIANQRERAITIDPARVFVDDQQGHAFSPVRGNALKLAVEQAAVEKLRLDRGRNQDLLAILSHGVDQVPALVEAKTLQPGESWQGYVAFVVRLERPVKEVALRVQPDGGPEAKLVFSVERRAGNRKCPDGKPASPLGECEGDFDRYEPADDGPCLQETAKRNSMYRSQYWIAGAGVADSDVNRTLLANPASHAAERRSLVLRWIGYTVVALGVVAAVSTAVAIERVGHDPIRAPAGLAWLALIPVGGGMVAAANRQHASAIKKFNEVADVTGTCAVEW